MNMRNAYQGRTHQENAAGSVLAICICAGQLAADGSAQPSLACTRLRLKEADAQEGY